MVGFFWRVVVVSPILLGVLGEGFMAESVAGEDIVAMRGAQMRQARNSFRELPLEAAQGYPVPAEIEGRIWLAFPFFLRRGMPPRPPQLSSFGWIGWIDAQSGESVDFKRLDSDLDLNQGEHKLDSSIDMKQFRVLESQLYASMSQLLQMAANLGRQLTPEEQQAAAAYREAWQKIAQKPLNAQYYALNPQWFDALGIKP